MARPGYTNVSVTAEAHAELAALREELRRRGLGALELREPTISEIIREGVRLVRARAFPAPTRRRAS